MGNWINEEYFKSEIERISAITRRDAMCCEDTSAYVFHSRNALPDGTTELRFFRMFSRRDKRNGFVSIAVKKDTLASSFFQTALNTGLVFARENGDGSEYFGFTNTAFKALCGKLSLYDRSAEGNDYYRNVFLVRRIFSTAENGAKSEGTETFLDRLVFTSRALSSESEEGDSFRLVVGVTSDKAGMGSFADMDEMYRELKASDIMGTPQILSWDADDVTACLRVVFPEKAERYSYFGEENISLIPGVEILDSDCGRASWRVRAFIYVREGCGKTLCEKKRKHSGKFKAAKEGFKWFLEHAVPAYESYFSEIRKEEKVRITNRKNDSVVQKEQILEYLRKKGEYIELAVGKKKWKEFERQTVSRFISEPSWTALDMELYLLMNKKTVVGLTRVMRAG